MAATVAATPWVELVEVTYEQGWCFETTLLPDGTTGVPDTHLEPHSTVIIGRQNR